MKKIKSILIFVLIFAAAVIAYLFLRKPETPALVPTPAAPVTTEKPQSAIGQEFLGMLLSLKDLRLDGSIFKSDQWNALKDFSTPIALEPGAAGRPNPFAPFGEEEAAAVTTNEATVITATSATLNGLVDLSLASAPKLFHWGTTENLENATDVITETTNTGFFSSTLTGLSPGTTYFFRAEVVVGKETKKGEVLSFTTLTE